MFNIQKMEINHPTFDRLMLVALRLKGLKNQAEIARALNVPDQHITNWKTRGVPKDTMIDISDAWGFRVKWLRDNDGEMTYGYNINKNTPEAQVFLAMQHMNEATKYQVVKISDSLAEPNQNGHTPPKTGT
jgi:hypothetical protein